MAYVRHYVPSGIVTEEVLDNIEKAKQPLVKIYHYHVNHLGTPQELSDESGNIIWLSYDRAWGGSFDSLYRQQFVDNWAVSENELQPFKFQGQCLDTETGLHYNRFRYYDSDVGMFIQRDPIGLLGGSNVFQYAPNSIGWIDPWGLAKVSSYTVKAQTAQTDTIARGVHVNVSDGKSNFHVEVVGNKTGEITSLEYKPIDPTANKLAETSKWSKVTQAVDSFVLANKEKLAKVAEAAHDFHPANTRDFKLTAEALRCHGG